jgi:hypothetical protein
MVAALKVKRVSTPKWDRWQSTAVAKKYLSVEMRQSGYTIVRVSPACREAFVDTAALMRAYGEWAGREQMPTIIDHAFKTWWQWSYRLYAVLYRMLDKRSGAVPPIPASLDAFVSHGEAFYADKS